jgi:hypothetical protein
MKMASNIDIIPGFVQVDLEHMQHSVSQTTSIYRPVTE